jgi:hypothetical protein
MRPKLAIFITFFFVAVSNLWGQNSSFAPIGARWYYRPYETLQYLNSRLYTFTVTKDTLLDGLMARELTCSVWEDGLFKDYPNLNKYVHVNADAVLYRVDNQWVLLFDFGAMPGDTILSKVAYFDYFGGCNEPNPGETWDMRYIIDSTSIETIDGIPLRVQYVRSMCASPLSDKCWTIGGSGLPEKIVERIGAIDSEHWWGQGAFCILEGFQGYLRCYQDELINYTGSIGNTTCDYVVGTDNIETYGISVSPNPTQGVTMFDFSSLAIDLEYKVFDCFGQVIKAGNVGTGNTPLQIDLNDRPSGVYFAHFYSRNNGKVYKIIKN